MVLKTLNCRPFSTGNVNFKLRLQPESYFLLLTLTREGGGGALSSTVNTLNINGYVRELKYRT